MRKDKFLVTVAIEVHAWTSKEAWEEANRHANVLASKQGWIVEDVSEPERVREG